METQEDKHKLLKPLLAGLLAILLIAVTGFGVWWWKNGELQKQRTDSDKKISELQKQVNDLKKTQNTASLSTATANQVTSQKYLAINEWSVKGLNNTSGITLDYAVSAENPNVIYFSSKELETAANPYCGFAPGGKARADYTDQITKGVGAWVGISRTTNGNEQLLSTTYAKVGKLINGYYYAWAGPQSTCAPSTYNDLTEKTVQAAKVFYDSLQ